MKELIGKSIIAIRGWRSDMRRKKEIEPAYILFSDQETIMCLDEQDYYDYHDCSTSAREIRIFKDKKRWFQIFNDKKYYPDANYFSFS